MNTYELTVILRSKDVDTVQTKMKDILEKHGVTITSEEPWGNKKLAYEIENEREGYYYFGIVQAKPETVDNVIADFRLNPDILRHLFVKIKAA